MSTATTQEKVDLAKIILYRFLLEKPPQEYTKSENEITFWLSSDRAIQEALKINTPASS